MSVDPPDLYPLRASYDADAVEADLKQIFIDLFDDTLRVPERDINVFGMAHLGSFSLIERVVTQEGLALYRKADEYAMRYLYRAWRARNPKRGLHFLRTYLQLLWPEGNRADQLWQRKSLPYPTGLLQRELIPDTDPHERFILTSRIGVEIDEPGEQGAGLLRVLPALRSVVAARFILVISIARSLANADGNGLAISNGGTAVVMLFLAGEATLPPPPSPAPSSCDAIAAGGLTPEALPAVVTGSSFYPVVSATIDWSAGTLAYSVTESPLSGVMITVNISHLNLPTDTNCRQLSVTFPTNTGSVRIQSGAPSVDPVIYSGSGTRTVVFTASGGAITGLA